MSQAPPTPSPGYEGPGINYRKVLGAAAILVSVAVFIQMASWIMLGHFLRPPADRPAPRPEAALRDARPLPNRLEQMPGPRLEGLKIYEDNSPAYRTSRPVPPTGGVAGATGPGGGPPR